MELVSTFSIIFRILTGSRPEIQSSEVFGDIRHWRFVIGQDMSVLVAKILKI